MLIKNINLIDGTGSAIQQNVDVIIQDHRFKTIGQNLNHENHEIIDGTDKYLLPGMIDSHVHIMEEM
ncbi:amidohydrolase family protein, partial [bacterium M00.F.Ca.ET.177.01.1.1]